MNFECFNNSPPHISLTLGCLLTNPDRVRMSTAVVPLDQHRQQRQIRRRNALKPSRLAEGHRFKSCQRMPCLGAKSFKPIVVKPNGQPSMLHLGLSPNRRILTRNIDIVFTIRVNRCPDRRFDIVLTDRVLQLRKVKARPTQNPSQILTIDTCVVYLPVERL